MISNLNITNIGTARWRLSWTSSTDGPFYIWRDGVRIAIVLALYHEVTVTPGTAPVFDVFDDPAAAPTAVNPSNVVLAWDAAAGADAYKVESETTPGGGTYSEIARIVDDGRGYFTYESGAVADVTIHRFRITPLAASMVAGTMKQIAVLMVRIPDPPAATFAYSAASKEVTVTVA